MAIDKRNHFPPKKFNNIIHNITINIHPDIHPSYYPYIHEITNTLANHLHHQAANNPIKAYANKQLQACHYQNPAFLSHINIPLLCASKTHPHDDSTIIREITHLIKNNFAGYFWAMNGREPIFSKSLCLISEQMHKNYLEQIQILEKEFHFKTDDLNTALFTHIEPIRITLESPEYVTEWIEVDPNTPWVHSIYQPLPKVYNERAFDRKLFKRIKDGKVQMKEEFEKKMEYEYHYLADSRSDQVANAEYDKAKINIANRTNREVEEISNKEAENEVIYLLPTPDSAEWTDIYKHDKVEYGLSNDGMFWYHSVVKARVIADCVASKKETPDAFISNCFKCIPSIESPETHKKFIEDLCQADSWLEVKAVITKYASLQTRNFRRRLEIYLTREINLILSAAIGIKWKIGSFYDDIEDLHKEIEADYGEIYLKALERSYKKGSIFINHLSDSDVESFRSEAASILVPYEDLADIKDFTCVAIKSLVLSVCESSGDLELNVGYDESKQINPKEAKRLYKLLDNLLNEVGRENEVYLTTEGSISYRVFRNELDSTSITIYNDTRLI